ncbi:cellulase family glycosylhydrolase [Actinoplanes sp. N902-109]|uniref:cellulase family glycosylhydrolase n=1 Tax=Actinoplanes sp. (strain N902-109) TaxID=649831 RepID=UPI0003A6CEED|nr:cellulase family glycosylhydrolase [Actinoplanes sp. N902-109]
MRHRSAFVTGAAAVLLGVAVAATVPVASAAATGCSATYTVAGQWQGGFQGTISFTNLGDPLTGWKLEFDFPAAGQTVNQGWNATWAQTGNHVSATNESWNGGVGTGAPVSLGFVGSFTGSNPAPTAFRVNGVPCTGSPTTPPPTTPPPTTPPPAGGGAAPALHVSGNKLVTAAGTPYRLLGVNRSSGEFACVQGKGMWDGDPSAQANIDAMKAWNVHAVRLPLNEDCWLGLSGSPSGSAYQLEVKKVVDALVANGITPILDLHWTHGQYTGNISACTDVNATCQKPMPSMQYTPQFWTGVANTFKANTAVVFDLFNEPYPDAADNWANATAEWTCLRDGGACAGISYEVAGMQDLVDAVRATGARNVLMTAGLTWTNDLSQWLAYKPADPTGNLMASWHSYNFNACVTVACWDSQIGKVAAQVPVQAGEIGQDTCAHDYVDQVMAWADAHGVGYTPWTWNPWGGCSSGGNVLIEDWSGTPTRTYGEGVKAHLRTVNP